MNNTNQYNLNFINELTIFQTNQSNKEKLSNSIVLANNFDKQALFKVFDINDYNSFDKSYELIKQIEERKSILNLIDNDEQYLLIKNNLAHVFELVADNLLQNNNVIDA